MTWVKIDDQFRRHPKVRRLSSFAVDLYVTGVCYCSSGLTDGAIDQQGLEIILAETRLQRRRRTVIQELIDAELWLPVDGGFLVNDYLEYNPPASKVKERRDELSRKRSEAGKRGAEARWHSKTDGKTDGKDATSVASDGSMAPSRPVEDQKPLSAELALVMDRAEKAARTGAAA